MKSILQQTSWLFGAQALGRIIGFFYTIYLARSLGVEDFGLYSAALAYYSLFAALADFGFSRFLVREITRGSLKIAEVFSNITILRLTITSCLFAVFSLFLYIFDPDKFRVSLTLLTVLTVLPLSITQTVDSIFIAMQKMKLSAISLVALNIATIITG
ncbi:MAG: oligosaccharide flippase family protein, partial [Candidatus Daviesbacteria bacterium]|nr:oligosaccharide flippase family protein [Candidatus Daviesbacteria bacterium]